MYTEYSWHGRRLWRLFLHQQMISAIIHKSTDFHGLLGLLVLLSSPMHSFFKIPNNWLGPLKYVLFFFLFQTNNDILFLHWHIFFYQIQHLKINSRPPDQSMKSIVQLHLSLWKWMNCLCMCMYSLFFKSIVLVKNCKSITVQIIMDLTVLLSCDTASFSEVKFVVSWIKNYLVMPDI